MRLAFADLECWILRRHHLERVQRRSEEEPIHFLRRFVKNVNLFPRHQLCPEL
jgi:hypothetical protein